MTFRKTSEELMEFISNATSPFHVVKTSEDYLQKAGFTELNITKKWTLEKGGSYYVNCYGTSLFAFTIGDDINEAIQFRVAAAHTDHPCFKVKPHPEMKENGYMKLNTDVYGGPIVNTWLDRPLSIAGKVAVQSDRVFEPDIRYVDFKRPILTIPNLAIHMNREVNKGIELNRQKDTIPTLGLLSDSLNKDHFFLDYLAKELDVKPEDILDFDLYVYNFEDGCFVGMNEDLISSPRLDNLTSCYALLKTVTETRRKQDVNLIALFDNEEIGSKTKQGADSAMLSIIMEKITDAFSFSHTDFYNSCLSSYMFSLDVAHAIHPNRVEKHDPTNPVFLNEGVVLKLNSNQKYATDSEAVGMVEQLCKKYDIKYQKYVNRSDVAGGSTLGSITSSWIPMKTIDMGIPMLAMHSAREVMGAKDQYYMEQLVHRFFEEE